MDNRPDLYRTAWAPIDRHGDEAPIHGAMEADAKLERGDLDGVAAWRRILDAVKQLRGDAPAGTLH